MGNALTRTANNLLTKYNISDFPVDVQKIAEGEGVQIEFRVLPDDISGLLNISQSKKPVIIVNNSHSKTRQRFTIAHELGHFLMHKPSGMHVDKNFFRDIQSSLAQFPKEIEANRFAASLLMPERFVKAFIENNKVLLDLFDDDIIKLLADKFEVSSTAMSIRFQSIMKDNPLFRLF